MLSKMAQKLSSFFMPDVSREDREVYNYSFETLLATLLNLVVLCALAAITRTFWESLLFVAGFAPLRSLAGGYHSKTHFRCLLTLLLSYAVLWAAITFAPVISFPWINIVSAGVSIVLIWILSPVDDPNKPLSEREKIHFRKRSRVAILVYAAVIITGTCLFTSRKEFLALALGVLPVALSLAAAKLKSIWLNGHGKYIPPEKGNAS